MRIKAYAITKKGGRPEVFFYQREIKESEVLVKITHCSIARGDVQFISDDWGDARFPLVPGHEIVGIVQETGPAVVNLQIGDRVGIGYQQYACFECEFCKEGNEQFCPQQKVIAVDCYGGWAEYIIVDHRFAFKLPADLDPAKAAPLMSAGLTVFAGIKKAALKEGSTVAVMGIGGLGQLAIQFLHKMGHKVFAFSRSPEKQDLIRQLGADFINTGEPENYTGHNKSFDFILSTLNAEFDADRYLRLLKPEGKLCLVASPLSRLCLSAGLLYDFARRTIYGNYIGSRQDTVEMIDFSAKHNVGPAVDVMPLSAIDRAIEIVGKKDVSKRIVLEMQD